MQCMTEEDFYRKVREITNGYVFLRENIVTLDGKFTPDELRKIAILIEEYIKR